ncbi:MAG: TadE/TadG family type IV pilus assembly protein [Paracoccaceae bacterium]
MTLRRPRAGFPRVGFGGERGAITIEFVLWLPLLVLWLLAFVSLFSGFTLRNQAGKAHYAVADIVSRFETLSGPDVEGLFTLFRALTPMVEGGHRFRITQIRIVVDDDAVEHEVDWSCAFETAGAEVVDTLDDDAVPAGLIPTLAHNQRVLLVQSEVPYAPVFDIADFQSGAFAFDTVVRARRVAALELRDPGADCAAADLLDGSVG